MDDQTLRERLEQFGLSSKEIDTYFAVLDAGEAKTSELSDAADVSQRYVYSIAEDLEDRGLVTVNDHAVPTTIRAVPPEEAIEELVAGLEDIRPSLEDRYAETTPESATFDIIKSQQTVLKRFRSLLESASSEAFLALPARVVDDLLEEMRAARRRGVTVMLLEVDADPLDPADAWTRFEGCANVVRQWEQNIPFAVTVDAVSGVVGERTFFGSHRTDTQAVALSQSQIVGSVFGAYLSSFWPLGTEAFVAPPDDLPQTHAMVRPAALQADLHRRDGTEVIAEVEGRRVDGGEEASLCGPVVDVRQGLVEPFSNAFPVENNFTVEVDGERLEVGGVGAFIEDVEAAEIVLRRR